MEFFSVTQNRVKKRILIKTEKAFKCKMYSNRILDKSYILEITVEFILSNKLIGAFPLRVGIGQGCPLLLLLLNMLQKFWLKLKNINIYEI